MSTFINEVSALAYLEKEDFQRANEMLRLSAESNVLLISKYGAPALESQSPGSTSKWLTRYARIRSKYPPIDYSDGGALNERIEIILKDNAAKDK